MKKTMAILLASAVALTAVPARANDELIRLGLGIGAHIVGEAIKGAKNRPKVTPREQRSRSSSSSGASSARAAPAPKRQADPQVKEAQQLLSDLGYKQVGKPDGFAGNNTTKAILAFKKDNEIGGDDAKIDAEFIAALKAIKANTPPTAVAATATAGAAAIVTADAKAEPIEEVAKAAVSPPEPEISQEDYLAAAAAEGPISSPEPISEDIAEAVAAITPKPAAETPTEPEAKPEAEVAKVEEQKPAPDAMEPMPAPVVEVEGFTISDDF